MGILCAKASIACLLPMDAMPSVVLASGDAQIMAARRNLHYLITYQICTYV